MTIAGTVKLCTMKESGKSARLELNERQTRYTLFDIKHVPALQPGVPVTFEAAERSYKETTYWAVVDGSLRYPHAAVGATKPEVQDDSDTWYKPKASYDEYADAAYERMTYAQREDEAVERFRERKNTPPASSEDLIVIGARIADALERMATRVTEMVLLLQNK